MNTVYKLKLKGIKILYHTHTRAQFSMNAKCIPAHLYARIQEHTHTHAAIDGVKSLLSDLYWNIH